LPVTSDNEGHLSLPDLLSDLLQRGIHSVMVEGGAMVIAAFLRQGLVDRAVLTISPVFVGGLKALENPVGESADQLLNLKNATMKTIGNDFVIYGEFDR